MYKISIIVPFYNTISMVGERYLNKNIDSLLNQSYKNIEVIYINNNSSDDSANFIKEKINNDSRFKIVFELKPGVSNARNKGIDEATGDYITFVDSDDFVDIHYIEIAIEEFKKKNLDILIGEFTFYDDITGNIYSNLRTVAIDKFGTNIEDVSPAIECCPNIFFRTEFIIKNNIKQNANIFIGEDHLFTFTAIVKANRIKFFESKLYFYLTHNATMRTAGIDKFMTLIIVYNEMLSMLKNYNKINNVAIWYFNLQYNNFSNMFGYDSLFSKEFRKILKKYKIKLISDRIIFKIFCFKVTIKLTEENKNKMAWLIPVRKWRKKFRAKFNLN